MSKVADFKSSLESKVTEQLRSQRVGYLLGAGSSYLDTRGYPLSFELWNAVKDHIHDPLKRDEIQAKIDLPDVEGLENALDQLDTGGTRAGEHREVVANGIADLFSSLSPPLDHHAEFVGRLAAKRDLHIKIFSLNYDPLIERASELERARLCDGFLGHENAYFDASVFDERIGEIRGRHKERRFDETAKPIHLLKLHGSVGWFCSKEGVARRCGFDKPLPKDARRLMIPPQQRKAADTMGWPYQALWSAFRGALGQDRNPLHRLVCIGYGFADEHVNVLIEKALLRADFTLLIFAKELSDAVWGRWSRGKNVIVVTAERCSIQGSDGEGHPRLWKFEYLAKEV